MDVWSCCLGAELMHAVRALLLCVTASSWHGNSSPYLQWAFNMMPLLKQAAHLALLQSSSTMVEQTQLRCW
jgi:hypothetical protein